MSPQPSAFRIWWLAIRPKTLWAAVVPVMMGTALAVGEGVHHVATAVLALAGALLIQIGTNLANDYFDFIHGADTEQRVGPQRVTQAGLATPQQVMKATILVFVLAAITGLLLFLRAGWPVVVIAVFSICSGIAYTAGPKPLAYVGLGDIFVLVFFGPVAVGGTYFVQALTVTPTVLWLGLAPGLLSVAILTVNNLRDLESDREAGKKTLAVRFGRTFARWEYIVSVTVAVLLPVVLCYKEASRYYVMLTLLVLLMAIPAFKTVWSESDGKALNPMLAYTGKLLLIYGVLFSIGWNI